MLKSIGFKKINIAIFISGTGSNLKNLIKNSNIIRECAEKYGSSCTVLSIQAKKTGDNL